MDKRMPTFVKRLLIIIPCVILLLILVFGCFDIVPAGYKGVKLTMGAVSDTVLNEMCIRDRRCPGMVHYSERGRELPDSQQMCIRDSIKSVTSKYTAEETITRRSDISAEIKEMLKTRLSDKYIFVDSLNITDLTFSAAFDKAIEEKQVAEQNALKAKYDLDRIKTEAEQAVIKAQGEAEAMRIKNETLTDSIIELEFLNKWDGHMPTYYGGDADLLLSLDPDKTK